MHDFLVHRRAQRRRIPAIPLERRLRAARAHQPLGQLVEVQRRHTRRHRRLERAPARRPPTGWPSASARSRRPTGRQSPRPHDRGHGRRDVGRHRLERLVAVDRPKRRPAPVELHNRLRLPRVDPQPLLHDPSGRRRIRCTSGPPHEPHAVSPTTAGVPHLAQIRRERNRSTSVSSGTSMSTTTSGCRWSSKQVQRLGLRQRPRKPVEHEPAAPHRPRPAGPARSR